MLISKFKKDEDVVNIHDLQELIGLKLPSDYAVFLQKYNGGITPKTNWNGKGKSDIRAFFGYKVNNKNYDFQTWVDYEFFQNLLLNKKIPIAVNISGDHFCIDCLDGSIWFIRHDSTGNKLAARTFKDFIMGCKSKKIGHVKSIEERLLGYKENFGEDPSEITVECWQEEIDYYSNIHQEEVVL